MSDKVNETLAKLSNPTVRKYLTLMADTETPPIFHAWSLLSAASACLTRRKWFPLGAIKVMPNQYMMLVGPPGVRKSQGIKFTRKLLEDVKGIRFAPNSTAGQLQGLMSAMQGDQKRIEEEDEAIAEAFSGVVADFGAGLLGDDEGFDVEDTNVLDRHALYVAESELVSFLGRNMDSFINFLGDMWDKSDDDRFTYRLKREETVVHKPCLNMIGAITPMHIVTHLPPQAIGQGFTSRVIMIYAEDGKKNAWPEPIDEQELKKFKNLMHWIFNMEIGPFEYTPEAKAAIIRLYDYKLAIEDIRFLHYGQRRQTHKLKVAMALAALRMSNTVTEDDINDAHALLCLAEERMVDCLGEYGMSPQALARSRVSEVLRNASEPLTVNRILMGCGADVNQTEIKRAIYEMTMDTIIVELRLEDSSGAIMTGYVWPTANNPFNSNEKVSVDYMVKEGVTERRNKVRRQMEDAAFDISCPSADEMPEAPDVPDASAPAASALLPGESIVDMIRRKSQANQGAQNDTTT